VKANAKINLALVVGPLRADGKHEVVTVYQRVALADEVDVEPADETTVTGFAEDTIVRTALAALDAPHGWRVHIEKEIPVAAGLGGGSSDAAAALQLASAQLAGERDLHTIASRIGADVPFFLREGPQLGTGDGTMLEPLALPQDYAVLLLLPEGEAKRSTADVYAAFDERQGARGFDERAAALRDALERNDLAALPPNDLAQSPHAERLLDAGALRADVSGAGPALYALFPTRDDAVRAARELGALGRFLFTRPAW
jgi:4-diphosphocytidyl-2-C-methyl-D-erythritol kinase